MSEPGESGRGDGEERPDGRAEVPPEAPPATPDEAPTPAGRGGGRRRGRKRRALLRIFVWAAVAVVVAVAVLQLLAVSPWGRERARRLIEVQLADYLGRPVEVGSVSALGLVPIHAEVLEVTIAGADGDEPPFASARRVRVDLDVRGVLRPVVTVERVVVERPEVWLIFRQDGSNNLPEIRRGEGDGRVEVRIGRLTVVEGIVHFADRRVPVSFDAAPVRATLAGEAAADVGSDELVATAVAQALTVGLPDARPWGGAALARFEIGSGRLDLAYARLRGPDLDARVSGGFTWGDGDGGAAPRDAAAAGGAPVGEAGGDTGGGTQGGVRGRVRVEATGGLALANRLGYLEQPVAGDFDFVGDVEVAPQTNRYGGRVSAPAVAFLERRFTAVEATVEGSGDGILVEVEQARHAGGELTATVRVAAVEEEGAPRPVSVVAHGRGLALARLIADLDLAATPVGGVRGAADADLEYRFTTAAPLDGDGGGVVRFTSTAPQAARLPLDGRVPFTVRRGVVAFDDAVVAAPGQRLAFAGSWDVGAGSGSFTYALASERLGRLAAALAAPLGLTAAGTPVWLPTAGTGRVEGDAEIGPALGGGRRIEIEALVELAAVELAGAGLGADGRRLVLDRVSAPLVYVDGVVSSNDLVVAGAGQRLMLAGRWDLAAAAGGGDFRLTSEDLARLAAFAPQAAAEPRPAWLPSAGRGRVEGELERAADGSLNGRASLDLEAVAFPGNRFDTLSGSLRLAGDRFEELRLEAASGEGALVVAGTLPLPLGDTAANGAPAAWTTRPLDLALDAVDWPLAGLAAVAPALPELAGRITGRVEATGSIERPEGSVRLAAEGLTVAGVALERAVFAARLAEGGVAVERLRLAAPAGELTIAGEAALDGSRFDLHLATGDGTGGLGAGLDLTAGPIAERVPGALTGRLVVDATLTGNRDEPRLDGHLSGRDLAVAGTPLGGDGRADLDVSWAAGELTLDGSLLGVARLTGGGRLDDAETALAVELTEGDLDALLRVVSPAGVAGLDGSFAGRLAVAGEGFAALAESEATLTLDRFTAGYRSHSIENLEAVVVRYAAGTVIVDSFFLGEPGGDSEVFVGGELAVGEEGMPLDLRLQADLDAAWLDLVPGGLSFGGRVRALATVGGGLAEPRINGQGEMADGDLLVAALPHAIEAIDAVVLFYPGRVVLDSLGARMAGGALRAAGEMTLPAADREATYRFQLAAVDVGVRAPEGFLLRGDANLSLTTVADGRLVSGTVDLDRAFYLEDVEIGITQLLRRVFEPSRLEAGSADPQLAASQLNVAVRGPGALRVRNNVADLSGDVDLVLRGTLASPVIFGRVDVDPGGDVVYADNEYVVERGRITFANPYRIDPVIDFVAVTEVRSYDVTLNLSGTLERLNVSFTSDPPLADLEVLALLTTGRPLGETAALPGQGVGERATDLIYGQAASVLSERVNALFGFDRFRVNPVTSSTAGSSLAVTVGEQISRDVYVTYTRDPSTPEVDIVQVEWQVADNVVAILTRNGDSTYVLDVQVERRF